MDKQELIRALNEDLAGELGAIIQYITYAAKSTGPYRPQLSQFFLQEVPDEQTHAQYLANKIVALGGEPTTTSSTFPPTTVSTTTTTLAPVGACGDPVDPPTVIGELPAVVNATDALFTLRTAVSLESCSLCVCDLDDSGSVTASDALALLLIAVGQPGSLDCPPCA